MGNVHVHQLDAERSVVPGGPFDAAMSLLGVMFFDDPVAVFANVRAQLRPGGRVAFLAWAEPSANPLLAEVMLDHFVSRPPVGNERGSFSMADPVRFQRVLEGAGFTDVTTLRRGPRAVVDESVLFNELLLDVYGVEEWQKPAARLHVQETLRVSKGFGGIEVSLAVNIAKGRATS